jgi:hydrogenase expression/formation protein HypC
MCYAIPGRVISIKGKNAIVEYGKEKRKARTELIKIKKGDYVIVSAGFIIKKVPKKDALKSIAMWKNAT